jgi:alkylhydroperoxidase family enzyme
MAAPIVSMSMRGICGKPARRTSISMVSPVGAKALIFTEAEKAALEWSESLTHIDLTHAPDSAYEPLKRYYDDKQIANITYAIALMNAWNRIAIGFHQGPVPRAGSRHSA